MHALSGPFSCSRAACSSGCSSRASSSQPAPRPPPALLVPPCSCSTSGRSSSSSTAAVVVGRHAGSSGGRLASPWRSSPSSRVVPSAMMPLVGNTPDAVDQEDDADILSKDNTFSVYTKSTITYAMSLARAAETYNVHPWYLLLGLLKHEECTACKVLKELGLDDLYGAWHEVLWATRVSDGLERKPFQPEIGFSDRAYKVLKASVRYAHWGGRTKVQSEDLLLALAASSALAGIFPDLNLNFGHVRAAVERVAGGRYVLPTDEEEGLVSPTQSADVF